MLYGLQCDVRRLLGQAFAIACALTLAALPAFAQGSGGSPAVQKAPGATAPSIDSAPAYVRRDAPDDAGILRIWEEGMQRSQVANIAQVLLDSIGPRLTGSPNMDRAQDWAVTLLSSWGVDAKKEQYGTWDKWKRGVNYVSLLSPRIKTLDATMLSWSGNTGGQFVEGGVVIIAPYQSYEEYRAWLPTVRGKVILSDAPRLSCRSQAQINEFGAPRTIDALDSAQQLLTATYSGLAQRVPSFYADVKAAGALSVFESNWSYYPGIQKIFGSPRNNALPTLDIGCEDYGMLFRLAQNDQSPTVRLMVESESFGEQPVYNVIGTIRGSEKPNEYVLLSAHYDSWEGHSGATDNGTGSVTMLEALRILKTVYPQPKRTIIIGLWSGEEQGLNGSGAFAADHPEVVAGLQFAFNQDNGTGRVVNMSPNILPKNGERLSNYLSAMPAEITQWVRLGGAGMYSGGSDHVSFACRGAPATTLGALSWDYGYSTWHTQRDSYDKLVIEDVKNNAVLTAMLAYMASEDPEKSSRELMNPMPEVRGVQMAAPTCGIPSRNSQASRR